MGDKKWLNVTMLSAKGLKDVHTFGTMNPYAKVWIDSSTKHCTPAHSNGGCTPVWGHKLALPLPPNALKDETVSLSIQIWSQGSTSDTLVGSANLPISQLIRTTNPTGVEFMACQLLRPSGRVQGLLNFSIEISDHVKTSGSPVVAAAAQNPNKTNVVPESSSGSSSSSRTYSLTQSDSQTHNIKVSVQAQQRQPTTQSSSSSSSRSPTKDDAIPSTSSSSHSSTSTATTLPSRSLSFSGDRGKKDKMRFKNLKAPDALDLAIKDFRAHKTKAGRHLPGSSFFSFSQNAKDSKSNNVAKSRLGRPLVLNAPDALGDGHGNSRDKNLQSHSHIQPMINSNVAASAASSSGRGTGPASPAAATIDAAVAHAAQSAASHSGGGSAHGGGGGQMGMYSTGDVLGALVFGEAVGETGGGH